MERAILTPTQKEVLDLMWDTTTEAPVGRRRDLGNNQYELYKATRLTRPIDFPARGFEGEEFALKLHERKIDAPLSPYYINLRNMPDNLLTKVAEAIAEATQHLKPEVCTGIPAAGDPIALKFEEITGISYRGLFEKAEDNSGRKIVPTQRRYGGGLKVLILDDLITEADTKFEALEAAQQLGYEPVGIAVLVDRQQGGSDQLRAKGFEVFAPILVTAAFEHYLDTGKIDYGRYLRSMDYLNGERTKNGLAALKLRAA